MATTKRSLEQIQAAIAKTVEDLAVLRGDLSELLAEVEEHLPPDIQAICEGEACPPAAWEGHGGLDQATEALREAETILGAAGRSTDETARAAWLRRCLKDVKDPAARSLLCALAGLRPEPDDYGNVSDESAIRRAWIQRLDEVPDPATRLLLRELVSFRLEFALPAAPASL